MLRDRLADVFHKVQQNSSCHQKYRHILRNLYDKTTFEDFEIEFMRCVEQVFGQDGGKNAYADRALSFAATFTASLPGVMPEYISEISSQHVNSPELQTYPFLNIIVQNTLQYHTSEYVGVRIRVCQFVDLILRNIGENGLLETEIWNVILNCLLERIKDMKAPVRIQSIRALARLQSPLNSECPVIHAFLGRMYDINALVRKEIVDMIAPTPVTSSKIVEKVRDADHVVRLAAYRKCSKMGPKMVKLVDRQSVLMSGFNEKHEVVKHCFIEDTLPKWLSAYNGNYLRLLHALKIDAFEEDIQQTEVVCKNVLEVFLRTHQLSDIIEYLPLDENKVIPFNKLSYEASVYWSILVGYLRQSDKTEDYLENVIPELLEFCKYVTRIVKENAKVVEGWVYLEYQHILQQLIHIAGGYDLGDEVGRKELHALGVTMLTETNLNDNNIKEIIGIMAKINPILDSLTTDICSLISEIQEPCVAEQPTENMLVQNKFKIAELRVKINILNDEKEEAVKNADYKKAGSLKLQLIELNKQIEDLREQFESHQVAVRTPQNDTEILCRCLSILIGMLSYPGLKTLTASLRICKDEFIKPLCDNNHPEVHWRVYKCIALCCMLDRQLAEQTLKLICSPIIFYRLTPQDETAKRVLLVSIGAVSDIVRLYSTDIFGTNEEANVDDSLRRRLNGTKKLHRTEDVEEIEDFDFNSVTWKDIIDTLLNMIDDERADIREEACKSICELILSRIAVSPELIARLILKWFNPLTEKHDQKLQVHLGTTFVVFAQLDGTEEILEKAVLPVLTQLGNAPPTSPLADVDLDNALRFLAAITSIQHQPAVAHKNLMYRLCHQISAQPRDKCVPIYIKMLLNLELCLDPVNIKELINQAELILDDIFDRAPKRNLQKFVFKLKQLLHNDEENEGEDVNKTAKAVEVLNGSLETSLHRLSLENAWQNRSETVERPNNVSVTQMESNLPVQEPLKKANIRLSDSNLCENSPVKRRKYRGRRSKESSISSNDSETTVLHTIIEADSFQLDKLNEDDLTIHSPSTTESSNSNGSIGAQRRTKKVVVSETSSDSESNTKVHLRPKKVLVVSDSGSQSDGSQTTKLRRSLRKGKSQKRYL